MTNDAKLGLLAGLLGVVVIAVLRDPEAKSAAEPVVKTTVRAAQHTTAANTPSANLAPASNSGTLSLK